MNKRRPVKGTPAVRISGHVRAHCRMLKLSHVVEEACISVALRYYSEGHSPARSIGEGKQMAERQSNRPLGAARLIRADAPK